MATPADPALWGAPADSVEDLGKRRQNVKHFRHADGAHWTAVFGGVLHYEPVVGSGVWEDADTLFRASGAAQIADHLPFAANVNGTNLDLTDRGTGRGIRYTLPAIHTVNGNVVSFTWNGADATYTVTRAGVKLSATVAAPRGPQTYAMPYARLGGAGVLSLQPDGSVRGDGYALPAPFVVGADGLRYVVGGWTLTSTALSFAYDDSALPAGAYPYVLDPSTTFDVTATGNETATQRTGTTYPPTGAFSSSNHVYKYFSTPNYVVSNLGTRWDTSSIGAGRTVLSATATFWPTSVLSGDNRNVVAEWYASANWPIDSGDWTDTPGAATAGSWLNSSFTSSAYNTVALTAAAANVNTTGYTGLRWSIDGGIPTTWNLLENIATYGDVTHNAFQLTVLYTAAGQAAPIVQTGFGTSASGTSLTVNWGTGAPAAGNLLLLCIATDSGTTPSTPAGWGVVSAGVGGTGGSARKSAVFGRSCDGTDVAAPAFTVPTGASVGVVYEIAGQDASVATIMAGVEAASGQANASGTNTTPALNPADATRRLFIAFNHTKNAATWSAETIGGTAATENQDRAVGTTTSLVGYSLLVASTGTGTYAGAATPSANALGSGHTVSVALLPAPISATLSGVMATVTAAALAAIPAIAFVGALGTAAAASVAATLVASGGTSGTLASEVSTVSAASPASTLKADSALSGVVGTISAASSVSALMAASQLLGQIASASTASPSANVLGSSNLVGVVATVTVNALANTYGVTLDGSLATVAANSAVSILSASSTLVSATPTTSAASLGVTLFAVSQLSGQVASATADAPASTLISTSAIVGLVASVSADSAAAVLVGLSAGALGGAVAQSTAAALSASYLASGVLLTSTAASNANSDAGALGIGASLASALTNVDAIGANATMLATSIFIGASATAIATGRAATYHANSMFAALAADSVVAALTAQLLATVDTNVDAMLLAVMATAFAQALHAKFHAVSPNDFSCEPDWGLSPEVLWPTLKPRDRSIAGAVPDWRM